VSRGFGADPASLIDSCASSFRLEHMSKVKGSGAAHKVVTGRKPAGAARRGRRTDTPDPERDKLIDEAVATELAPAAAIALLSASDRDENAPAPALECLAAGAAPSTDDDKVRVQLMFENGTVLPVEMSREAGQALNDGLTSELGNSAPQADTVVVKE
jgi:hypothetical protein